MNRKFIVRLSLLVAFGLSLHSCMHDDFANKEAENHSSTFGVFQKTEGKDPDYARGFALLYNKYKKLHPEFSESVSRVQKEGKPSVYFYMSSQVLILEDGSKAVLYPILQGDKVVGIEGGILNKEEDFVFYKILSETTDGYSDIINAFSVKLNSRISRGLASREGDECGSDVALCGDIEPIVIVVPPKGFAWNGNGSSNEPSDNPPIGGCGGFGNCGGGSGGNTNPQQNQNPCAKLKTQNADVNYKAKTDFLKTKTGESFEYGFRVNKPVSGQTGTQYQQMSGTVGNNTINFKYFGNTNGYMHSHFDGLVPMFSPDDINMFIKLLINANNNGIPLSEIFISVVNPDGTVYQLRGDGIDVASLSIYDQNIIDNVLNGLYLGKDYDLGKANQDPEYYQKIFLKFMKDQMSITGAKLYSVNSEGKSKEVYLQNNTLKTTDCPQ